MSNRPEYFEPIRLRASRRWDHLEEDPELAGPWHQLFSQVQSPRHVLSELLQNADDAKATEASVRIEDQVFIFEHDGEDFGEPDFACLCRFGYSNKRLLHTIGFRGIGFKSTFSLGDIVEVYTPTLSIGFERKRFTEPRWTSGKSQGNGKTLIRVRISDLHRQRQIEKNIEDWLKSPVSLLFFKNIRRIQMGDRVVHWDDVKPGPIPESKWVKLRDQEHSEVLVLCSEEEAFPEDALAEIRQERMVRVEENVDFPPCKVEIVLGTKGRLFVVLPTGVETELPFACNAPFIQDPARLKIKDPETSPTNRWLLERAGRLAATAMLNWLARTDISLEERAAAYDLLPDVNFDDSSLNGVCGTIVEKCFAAAIADQRILLTEDGQLTIKNKSVLLPSDVVHIWPAEQAAKLLDEESRPPLCLYINAPNREKLLNWEVVEEIDKQDFIDVLQKKHLPKPETWRRLMCLWTYVAPEVTGYWNSNKAKIVRIVPVQGKDTLYAASEVVRLGEKKLLNSESDWDFLAKHLIVLNQNWPRFLAEQRRIAAEDASELQYVQKAYGVLEAMGLQETSDVTRVIDRVAAAFFSFKQVSLRECVQLAQIAAKLGVLAGGSFRFATRDRLLRSITDSVLFDENGSLEEFVPEQQRATSFLHPDYVAQFSSCSFDEWRSWISTGRAGLLTFVPIRNCQWRIHGRNKVEQEARNRGYIDNLYFPYVTSKFTINDWDFDEGYWMYWESIAEHENHLWANVAGRILAQRESFWSKSKGARIFHVATNGSTRSITAESLLPSWILRFRDLPCLPDTRGFPRKPGELLRRTPQTEPLMDVEAFVNAVLDNETNRPLLDLLGVGTTPTGPDRLLDCLRTLSKAEKPPLQEVDKWYRRLDQIVDSCSTVDFQKIKESFWAERLILTQDGDWVTAPGVFLTADEEDAPGAAVIRSSVADLSLWRKIDLPERPTADLAVKWLKGLPAGQFESQDDARRARILLSRHPVRVWQECEHWLNLAGEWVPKQQLSYALTMQSLVPWRHLHPWVKQRTADLQRLPMAVTTNPPFSELPELAGLIEDRFERNPLSCGSPEEKAWLIALGTELRRVELETEDDSQRVRALAERLARTKWQGTSGIEIIPYIDGTPAGTPRQTDVFWLDETVYVGSLPKAKLAKRVPEEIGREFGRDDIKAALDYSFERSPHDVREYLEENFKLVQIHHIPEAAGSNARDAEVTLSISGSSDITPNQSQDLNETGQGAQDGNSEMVGEQNNTDAARKEEGAGTTEAPEERVLRVRHEPKTAKPPLMESFAKAQGFHKESDDRYFRDDGSWIARTKGARFPWERRAASGDLVLYYWPKDHCFEDKPLEVEADIWALLDRQPETYALVLLDGKGSAIEFTGKNLRAMCEDGKITLYPASYRLVYNYDTHAKEETH